MSDVPCKPVVGTRESGLPFGAYLCQHHLSWLGWSVRKNRKFKHGSWSLIGLFDLFQWKPDETCMWHVAGLILSFHPCSLEVRSERPIQSSLPPGYQAAYISPLPPCMPLHSTPRYGADCLIHAFKSKSFHLQLNKLSYFFHHSQIAIDEVSVKQFCLATFVHLGWPFVRIIASREKKKGKKKSISWFPPLSRAKQTATFVTAQWISI